jgi:hypothetical protein
MFSSQTVVILGAGASAEVDMPVGRSLAQQISEALDVKFDEMSGRIISGDGELYRQIKEKAGGEAFAAAALIRDGIVLADSIDDFLERHKTKEWVVKYGKAAIARLILSAERESLLSFRRSADKSRVEFREIADTWYVKFLRLLARGVPFESASTLFDSVTFIDFNYDRCLEHFLREALKPMYGIGGDEADEILVRANIFHPYGSLGNLPTKGVMSAVPFGASSPQDFIELSDRIRTYSEQISEYEQLAKMRQSVRDASTLIFLGLYFHPQNMALLSPPEGTAAKHVFATGFRLSDPACAQVRYDIAQLYPEHRRQRVLDSGVIKLEREVRCHELFDMYAKTLTLV